MRLTYTMLLATIMLLGCQPGKKSASADAGVDAGPGYLEGQCGLEGTLVECNVDVDCYRFGSKFNYCTKTGGCRHDMPGIYSCFNVGEPCLYEDKVCGIAGLCTYACATHEDCPDTQHCVCNGDGSYCDWERCSDGACPEGFHPHSGSLVCVPDSRVGECHGPNNVCPGGYTKIADNVGATPGWAACVADATSL